MEQTLRAVEVAGPSRWRWVLSSGYGRVLADHRVDLDTGTVEYEAFCDLYGSLRRHRLPDDPVNSETRLTDRVGAWIGRDVFGEGLAGKLRGTVRVVVPEEADFLLSRPLELAHVDGIPLARRQVSLVYELPGHTGPDDKQPVGESVRILALFSMPSRSSVLALRQERYRLTEIVRTIAAKSRKAIELRVLQYGVTRERLAEAVEEHPGWDVLHVSGHGGVGTLLLEHANGEPDTLSTEELVELLRPAQDRLKLAVLSACNSGAKEAADALYTLGLDKAAERIERQAEPDPDAQVGLAHGLVEELGLAALAMRYPVADGFAVALAEQLYPRLLRAGQPVDRAVPLALPKAAGPRPTAAVPAASIGTPMLFGAGAVGLRVAPPDGKAVLDPYAERMAWFPQEPKRFVGRTQALVEASTALAAASGRTGVLFVGTIGIGKSHCALELAHQHRGRFGALAWWEAPAQLDEFGQALGDFAEALDKQLGIPMTKAVGSEPALRRFLPRLTALLREEAVLLVLNNVDALLSETAAWRDPMWALLLHSLVDHGGLSRVVLTSRTAPADLDATRVLTLPIHALSVAESVLLARELPHLGPLLHEAPTTERQPAEVDTDRELARRILNMTQGHPTLLELADRMVGDPEQLSAALAATETAGRDAPASAFFATGASDLDGGQFMRLLTTWTATALDGLPAPARTLAQLLAYIEDNDRVSAIVELVWPTVWAARHREPTPALPLALDPLVTSAIVETEQVDPDEPNSTVRYRLQQGVAEAIRASIEPELRSAIDDVMAEFLFDMYAAEEDQESDGNASSWFIARLGLAATPYLLRSGPGSRAVPLLEAAIDRDPTPATVNRAHGYLLRILDGETDPGERPDVERAFARTLAWADPDAGVRMLRTVIDDARDRGQLDVAWHAAANLAALMRRTGSASDTLAVVEELIELAALAGLGPWTRLADECLRLETLRAMGKRDELRDSAESLLSRAESLPDDSGVPERVTPTSVREVVYSTVLSAASAAGDLEGMLDLNRRIGESHRRRDAPAHEQARLRLNESSVLLQLGRVDEAEHILLSCQAEFEKTEDFRLLGAVFTLRAEVAAKRDRPDDAIMMAQAALRYLYLRPEPAELARCHDDLAGYVPDDGRDGRDGVAHRCAAMLLRAAATRSEAGRTVITADDLRTYREDLFPDSLDQLTTRVEQTPGVRFGVVLAGLVPEPAELFDAVVGTMRRNAAIAAEGQRSWDQEKPALVDAMERAFDGEHDPSLFEGLDDVNRDLLLMFMGQLEKKRPRRLPASDRGPARFGPQIVPPLVGHTRALSSVAVGTLEGRPIAVTGGDDSTVRVWDLSTHRQIGPALESRDTGAVWGVANAMVDGRPIAVATHGTIQFWDLAGGEPIGKPVQQRRYDWSGPGGVWCVACGHKDGRPIAVTGGYDKTVRVWDLETRRQIGPPLTGHDTVVRSVACGELDGRPIAVTSSEDRTVRVWDLDGHEQIGSPLLGHEGEVESVAIGVVDGAPVAISGSGDMTVRLWDLAHHQQLGPPLTGHLDDVCSVAFGLSGGRPVAISGSADLTLRVWDLESHRQLGLPLTDGRISGAIKSVAYGEIENRPVVLAGSLDGTVRVWSLDAHSEMGTTMPTRFATTLPTTWTDPHTGTTFDLSAKPITDDNGSPWLYVDHDGFEPILAEPASPTVTFDLSDVHEKYGLHNIIRQRNA